MEIQLGNDIIKRELTEDSLYEFNRCYDDETVKTCNLLGKWYLIPYPGDKRPPVGYDALAGSWPTYFFKKNKSGVLTAPNGEPVCFDIENPQNIDFYKSLRTVCQTQRTLTAEQRKIAEYWGEGPATKQWTPIIDRLIDTYGLTPAMAGRVLGAVQAGINDAFVITWFFKYIWGIPRPIQLDRGLETALCTPYFPSYPSGHSVISGTAEVILSYFFAPEADRLRSLAEENGISRLYAGVHFLEDITEGLKLGRQIGRIIVDELSGQRDMSDNPIVPEFTKDLHAKLAPPPYVQAIPFLPLRARDCDLPLSPIS